MKVTNVSAKTLPKKLKRHQRKSKLNAVIKMLLRSRTIRVFFNSHKQNKDTHQNKNDTTNVDLNCQEFGDIKELNNVSKNGTWMEINQSLKDDKWSNPKVLGLTATVLLMAMLVTAAWSSNSSIETEEAPRETLLVSTNTPQQSSREYIYVGGTLLAIEEYGSTVSPTPIISPTPTPPISSGQAIVFDGNNYGNVTLPNTASFNSLGGFQIIWRVREAAHPTPEGLPGFVFSLPDIGLLAYAPQDDPSVYDNIISVRSGDTHDGGFRVTPTTFADSICKLQFDPANSRWTLETWNADGTGYVSKTVAVQNASNINLGNQTLGIGASYYQNRPFKGKLDYWRWIERVEPLGVFPSVTPPTGVTYLVDYEFDGNGNDSSGNGLNLTLTNSPAFESTP